MASGSPTNYRQFPPPRRANSTGNKRVIEPLAGAVVITTPVSQHNLLMHQHTWPQDSKSSKRAALSVRGNSKSRKRSAPSIADSSQNRSKRAASPLTPSERKYSVGRQSKRARHSMLPTSPPETPTKINERNPAEQNLMKSASVPSSPENSAPETKLPVSPPMSPAIPSISQSDIAAHDTTKMPPPSSPQTSSTPLQSSHKAILD